ncbi:Arginine N-methyltransferase 2 [Sorochytrium milnesiophthora]
MTTPTTPSDAAPAGTTERPPEVEVMFLAAAGKLDAIKDSVRQYKDMDIAQPDEEGRTALFFAAANGHLDVVEYLLERGHPWNVLDKHGMTAAEFAQRGGHSDIYERIVQEGVRAELIFGALRQAQQEQGSNPHLDTSAAYLAQKLVYTDSGKSLLDAEGNGVMLGWERPLMVEHTKYLCPRPGLKVLNVGFGLGIIDDLIHATQPAEHHVIEAHPDVIAYIAQHPLAPHITVHQGTWKDVLRRLLEAGHTYDAIFFDTYAEYYDDLREFSEYVPDLLLPGGVYSYFNGCGATNAVFNEVYKRIAELHLEELGMQIAWHAVDMGTLGDDAWQEARAKYFTLDTYWLPVCTYV